MASLHPLDPGPLARAARRSSTGAHAGELGTALPPFIDHHVHMHLFEPDAAGPGALAGVVDLGGDPAALAARAAADPVPAVRYAGAFLTAPGGYPAGRSWCPPEAVRELALAPGGGHDHLPDPIAVAVDEQARFGASVVKVALHADAGPVFDRATLDRVIEAAHAHGLPVAAHVEGERMSLLAIEAGVDALVHAPWTERVDDDLIERAAAAGQVWIPTLAIHARDARVLGIATDNVHRFREAGGRVAYGTDLGNGDLPPRVNPVELAALVEAGFAASELVAALADPWPAARAPAPDVEPSGTPTAVGVAADDRRGAPVAADPWPDLGVAGFAPGPPPTSLADVPRWLSSAVLVPVEDLELL